MNVLMKDDCAEVTCLLLDAGADASFQFIGKSLIEIAEEKGEHENSGSAEDAVDSRPWSRTKI